MSNRTTSVGTNTSSTNYDDARANDSGGGWIGYVAVTADQGSITAVTDLTSLSQAVTVGTSRRIKITAECRMSNSSGTGGCVLEIWESATRLQTRSQWASVADSHNGLNCTVVLTPSAGSHTYKLRGDIASTGTVTMRAGAEYPAFLLIEDVGPA